MVKELTRKMKDSGIEWIGEIPEDWEIVQMRYLANITTGNKDTVDAEIDGKYPFFIRSKNIRRINSYSYDGEGILTAGDGDIGEIFHYINGKVDFHQRVYLFYKFKKISGKLLYFNLKSNLKKHISFFNAKTTVDSLRLPWLKEFPIPLPPQSQQKEIADFLDKKVSEIDNIISKTKKAIEEYKKYKQSLITETVTKGLDKDVEMKDSGIEWVGEIPEHWDTIKFKDLFKFGSGLTITKSDLLDEGIKVINYGEIHSKYKFDLDINRDELKCVDKSYLENRKNALINKGDFVFCDTSEDREGSGNCIVLRENNDELIFAGSHTVTARLTRNENPIYIRYMIMASSIKEQISSTVVGIKVYSITQAILKTIIGVIPPLKEQEQIVSYLDKKTNQIDQIISTKEKLLIEMEAYKKSLIYETVTGKREVE